MKPCPLCNARLEEPFENLRDDGDEPPTKVWTIHHHCHGIDLWITGADAEECLNHWDSLIGSKAMTDSTEAIREAREQITSALAHLGFSDDSVRAPLHKAARNLKYALDAMVSKPWPAAVPEGEPSEVDGSAWDRLPPAPSAGVAKARAAQAKQVMPIIGPLLDAWDGLSNDTKGVINEESSLGKHLREIDQVMCADISFAPEVKADPLREALKNCRTSYSGFVITNPEQYPKVLADFCRELRRIDSVARAALAAAQPPAPITTEQHREQALYLLVLDQRLAVAAQCRDIQGKWQAAQDHHHDRYPMHCRLFPVGQGFIGGGEPSRGNG